MVDKIYYDAVNVLEHCCNEICGINDENQPNSKMIGLVNTRFTIDIAQAHSEQIP